MCSTSLAAALFAATFAPAGAVTADFGPQASAIQGIPTLVFDHVVPTTIPRRAVLTLLFQGDLNDKDDSGFRSESFETFIEGISIGVARNDGFADPLPALPSSQSGFVGEAANAFLLSTVLPETFIAPLIADGQIQITVGGSEAVDALYDPEPDSMFAPFSGITFVALGRLDLEPGDGPPANVSHPPGGVFPAGGIILLGLTAAVRRRA